MPLTGPSTTRNFPRAYMDTAKVEDPMMKRVDIHRGEIGSRSSGMPKGLLNEGLGIDHVSNHHTASKG